MTEANQAGAARGTGQSCVVRIVRGNPSVEELAALAAVLAAVGPVRARMIRSPIRHRWSDPASTMPRYPWPGVHRWGVV